MKKTLKPHLFILLFFSIQSTLTYSNININNLIRYSLLSIIRLREEMDDLFRYHWFRLQLEVPKQLMITRASSSILHLANQIHWFCSGYSYMIPNIQMKKALALPLTKMTYYVSKRIIILLWKICLYRLLNGYFLDCAVRLITRHFLCFKWEAVICAVFKLKIAQVIGRRVYVNNLWVRDRNIYVEETDRET